MSENAAPSDAARQEWLASVSELTALVAHEINNDLNGILLHIALMEQSLPAAAREELGVVKRLGTKAAGLLKRLQQYNRTEPPPLGPVDLDRVVREAVPAVRDAGPRVPVHLDLAADLSPVLAAAAPIARLVGLLLSAAAAAAAPVQGAVTVRTARAGEKVLLRVSDTGPPVAEDDVRRLFEPFFTARPGSDGIRLPVCKLLARRMHAAIQAETPPEGGLAVSLEMEAAEAMSDER